MAIGVGEVQGTSLTLKPRPAGQKGVSQSLWDSGRNVPSRPETACEECLR